MEGIAFRIFLFSAIRRRLLLWYKSEWLGRRQADALHKAETHNKVHLSTVEAPIGCE
jgi:hypothetical protein